MALGRGLGKNRSALKSNPPPDGPPSLRAKCYMAPRDGRRIGYARRGGDTRMATSRGTTTPGYVNSNDQEVLYNTEFPGTDHNQTVYALQCRRCRRVYGANGSDIHIRRCPYCGGGQPGLSVTHKTIKRRQKNKG